MIFCYNNDEFAIIPLGRLAVDIRDMLSQEVGSEYEIDTKKGRQNADDLFLYHKSYHKCLMINLFIF